MTLCSYVGPLAMSTHHMGPLVGVQGMGKMSRSQPTFDDDSKTGDTYNQVNKARGEKL